METRQTIITATGPVPAPKNPPKKRNNATEKKRKEEKKRTTQTSPVSPHLIHLPPLHIPSGVTHTSGVCTKALSTRQNPRMWERIKTSPLSPHHLISHANIQPPKHIPRQNPRMWKLQPTPPFRQYPPSHTTCIQPPQPSPSRVSGSLYYLPHVLVTKPLVFVTLLVLVKTHPTKSSDLLYCRSYAFVKIFVTLLAFVKTPRPAFRSPVTLATLGRGLVNCLRLPPSPVVIALEAY